MTEAAPEQRHEIYPSLVVSTPDDYPSPKAGIVTRLALTTPDKEAVGTLLYDDKGLYWTPANTEEVAPQEHAAEILNFIRGAKGEDLSLDTVVAMIRDAYVGDYAEDQVRFVPTKGE